VSGDAKTTNMDHGTCWNPEDAWASLPFGDREHDPFACFLSPLHLQLGPAIHVKPCYREIQRPYSLCELRVDCRSKHAQCV